MNEQESICLNCIYGAQPYGYYPIICVHGKRSKEMYHDKTQCKHFEACPGPVCRDTIATANIPADRNNSK